MYIYQAEKDAGLEEAISKSGKISYCSAVTVHQATPEEATLLKVDANKFDVAKGLHLLESILVSTGWNLNDDIFEKYETWISRHSGDHKPVNYMHNGTDIIGHSLNSYAVDNESIVLSDDLQLDKLPNQFHIVESSVLYTFWEDETLRERIETILAEIANDEWFVSVEALFNNFDYAIITPDHQNKIIVRNEETAFLTKHLRIYGGNGVYDNYRVGRVLRNMTFCGKGLVRRPANPNSVILSTNSFNGELIKSSEIFNMADDNKVSALEAQVAELTKRNAELLSSKNDEALSSLKETQAELAESKKNVETLTTAAVASEAQITELKNQITSLNAEKEKSDKEVENMKKEKKSTSRYAMLIEAGKSDVDAKDLIAKFDSLGDEQFADLMKYLGTSKATDEVVDDPTVDPAADTANASVIDQAKPDPDTGVVPGDVPTDEDTVTKLSAFLSKNCRFPLKNKGEK